MSIDAAKPADEVRAAIDGYCDVGEWINAGGAIATKSSQQPGGPRRSRQLSVTTNA